MDRIITRQLFFASVKVCALLFNHFELVHSYMSLWFCCPPDLCKSASTSEAALLLFSSLLQKFCFFPNFYVKQYLQVNGTIAAFVIVILTLPPREVTLNFVASF